MGALAWQQVARGAVVGHREPCHGLVADALGQLRAVNHIGQQQGMCVLQEKGHVRVTRQCPERGLSFRDLRAKRNGRACQPLARSTCCFPSGRLPRMIMPSTSSSLTSAVR
jgi:hypothetical protein